MSLSTFNQGLSGATAGQSVEALNLYTQFFTLMQEQKSSLAEFLAKSGQQWAEATEKGLTLQADQMHLEAWENISSAIANGVGTVGGQLLANWRNNSNINAAEKAATNANTYKTSIEEAISNPGRNVIAPNGRANPGNVNELLNARNLTEAPAAPNGFREVNGKTFLSETDMNVLRTQSPDVQNAFLKKATRAYETAQKRAASANDTRNRDLQMGQQLTHLITDGARGGFKYAQADKTSERAGVEAANVLLQQIAHALQAILQNTIAQSSSAQEKMDNVFHVSAAIAQANRA